MEKNMERTKNLPEINGNVSGIKTTVLERMKDLYEMRVEPTLFVSMEILKAMAEFTGLTGRELSVSIGRDGRVKDVSVGDGANVSMPSLRLTRNTDRLNGIRSIHTHPSGSSRLSDVDLGTLKSALMDAMCAVAVQDARPAALSVAFIGQRREEQCTAVVMGPFTPAELPHERLLEEIDNADERLLSSTKAVGGDRSERAVLVSVETGAERYDTMAELKALAETSGAEVIGCECQNRPAPDSAYYVGKGKAEELARLGAAENVDLFLFNEELSATQIRNLEELLGARVIDRTALILDIFAGRAKSREGRLQVELAQQKYRLSRLTGKGQSLSRLGGGIGTRGPGEKKLETDRRRIRRQIFLLEKELAEVKKQRELRRSRRKKNAVPVVAIVGYTNAGKSTFLNLISDSDVLAEDRLFATLDPVTRAVKLPSGKEVLFTDTVGFVDKLPHDLVEAFQSTLEEAAYADVILHVVDSSSLDMDEQMHTVDRVLDSIGAGDKPMVVAFNKTDKLETPVKRPGSVAISAKYGQGIDRLMEKIDEKLNAGKLLCTFVIPYSRGDLVALLKDKGQVSQEEYLPEGTKITAALDRPVYGYVAKQLGINEKTDS